MFKQIDRLLIWGYFKAYFVCLVSMLSLYVVVDLFTNLDEFTHERQGFVHTMINAGKYYGLQVPQIFDRLCEAIVLLAGMFTVAWMQKNNEILPLLSAGVSTRRIVAPILVCAFVMLSLAALNQEMLIPRIGNRLMNPKGDPDSMKEMDVQGQYEPNGIHIEGGKGTRQGMVVRPFFCLIREGITRSSMHLSAKEACYLPPENGRPGGWVLTGTEPAEPSEPIEDSSCPLQQLKLVADGRLVKGDLGDYFLKTQEVDFDALTRPRNWFQLSSTQQLYRELQKPESTRLAPIAVLFHMRLTRPVLGVILVVLGLSVILRDQNRNIFISAGMCLVLCAIFFAACFLSRQLGDSDLLAPTLAAWLPVLFFGPLAFVMFDAVHT